MVERRQCSTTGVTFLQPQKIQEAIKEKQKEGAKDSFECEDGKT